MNASKLHLGYAPPPPMYIFFAAILLPSPIILKPHQLYKYKKVILTYKFLTMIMILLYSSNSIQVI